ncbi:unnamed protein product [Alternaria alternata]
MRLLETEFVVLELLSTIYSSQVPIETQRLSDTDRRVLAESVQKQAKSSRVEEWKRHPLNTDEERLSWWSKRQDILTKGVEANASYIAQVSPASTEPWVTESSPAVPQYEDLQLSAIERLNVPPAQQPQPTRSAWQAVPDISENIEPVSVTQGQVQDMALVPPVRNFASEGYHDDRLERPAPSVQHTTALHSRSSTTEQWRKYF